MSITTDIMKELQAGEEARALVPQLQVHNRDLETYLRQAQEHNQQLEMRARDREDQISSLLERIRNAEKDRDDALMASLEVEDKLKSFRGTVEKFSSAVASALSGIGAANALLDPPKVVQPAPAPETVKELEGNVTGTTTAGTSTQSSGQSGNEQPSHGAGQSGGSQGQSEMGNASSNTQASSPQPSGQTTGSTDYSSRQEGSNPSDPSPPIDIRPW